MSRRLGHGCLVAELYKSMNEPRNNSLDPSEIKRRLILDRLGCPVASLVLDDKGEIRVCGKATILFELGTVLHPVPDLLSLSGEEDYLAGVSPRIGSLNAPRECAPETPRAEA